MESVKGYKGPGVATRLELGLTSVVDLAGAGVDCLEQLVDLIVRHLLAQICQDVLELPDSDEARHILVKDLESTAVLVRFAGVAESARPVQDLGEGLKVNCACDKVVSGLPASNSSHDERDLSWLLEMPVGCSLLR